MTSATAPPTDSIGRNWAPSPVFRPIDSLIAPIQLATDTSMDASLKLCRSPK
jgi:hypothetical protein